MKQSNCEETNLEECPGFKSCASGYKTHVSTALDPKQYIE